jgi:hypothetical protein
MLKIAGALALGIALGALFCSLVMRGTPVEANDALRALERSVHELHAEQTRRWIELGATLQDLRRELDEIVASRRALSEPREVIPAANPILTPSTETSDGLAEVNAHILRLEQGLAVLTRAVEQRHNLPQFPTAEQLRAGRQDVDRALLARISDAMSRNHESGLAMVRFLTFADVLAKVGRPTTINADGNWFYERDQGQTLGPEGFELDFINGYVVQVHSTDE